MKLKVIFIATLFFNFIFLLFILIKVNTLLSDKEKVFCPLGLQWGMSFSNVKSARAESYESYELNSNTLEEKIDDGYIVYYFNDNSLYGIIYSYNYSYTSMKDFQKIENSLMQYYGYGTTYYDWKNEPSNDLSLSLSVGTLKIGTFRFFENISIIHRILSVEGKLLHLVRFVNKKYSPPENNDFY